MSLKVKVNSNNNIISKRRKKYKERNRKIASIQVLISTMNQSDTLFLKQMNLQTDAVVGNQNGISKELILSDHGIKIKFICSKKKGLSNNRNLTLSRADSDICILADDDIVYLDGYAEVIRRAYEKYPKADVIIFNLYEKPIKRYIIKKDFRVNLFNYMRFGSVRISFRRKSILENNIRFDSQFGSGGKVPIGEDTLFLTDCLKKKLRVMAVSDYILLLSNNRESTWFRGYNDKYFSDKGKLYYRISKKFYKLLCLQDAIRHHKVYKDIGKWYVVYKMMIKEAKSI